MNSIDFSRRGFFHRFALGVAVTSTAFEKSASAQNPPAPSGPFTLPPLPYAFGALKPFIDAKTMEIHHDKHHQAYVNNLNKAISAHSEFGNQSVEMLIKNLSTVPDDIRTAVRNNGGGHANHSLFWKTLGKNDGAAPGGELGKSLDQTFGSYASFKEKFTRAALAVFGSGWAWLSLNPQKQLMIESTPNQDSPLTAGHHPLFGIDVWEHAYYLKYQNKRPDYVAAFYNVINWDAVSERYQEAMG